MLSLPVLPRSWSVPDPAVRAPRPSVFLIVRPRGGGGRAFLAWAALAVAAALLAPVARGDIQATKQRGKLPAKLVRNAPPSAVPGSEEIDPGEQVEITLEAHGGGNKSVDFDFATQPQHGVLTGFHLIANNKAVVTYVHDAASGPGHDQFTYRVQATGTAVSGPVAVDITIRDYPPRVALSPAELDFGAVNVGEMSRAQVTVRNDGGGLATGRMEPPEPWTVEGNADFHLAAGEKQTFRLVFKPRAGRSFAETMRVGDYGVADQHSVNLRLLGTGLGEQERALAGVNGVPPLPLESAATAAVAPMPPARRTAGAPVNPAVAPAAAPDLTQRVGTDTAAGGRIGAAEAVGGAGGNTPASPGFEPPAIVLNEAGVERLQPSWHNRTSLEIAWVEPKPKPGKYRVELRNISLDKEDNLRVDWQAYARVDFKAKGNMVSATLYGLPAGTNQSIRVVAVDNAGRFAAPSKILQVQLDPPAALVAAVDADLAPARVGRLCVSDRA